jgi:alkaline phosphatase
VVVAVLVIIVEALRLKHSWQTLLHSAHSMGRCMAGISSSTQTSAAAAAAAAAHKHQRQKQRQQGR